MVQSAVEGEKLIFSFAKKLDSKYCLEIEDKLNERIEELKLPVVFDLKNVDYICSAFLSICVRLHKAQGKERFSIINVSPSVKKVFKIAGIDKHIDIG